MKKWKGITLVTRKVTLGNRTRFTEFNFIKANSITLYFLKMDPQKYSGTIHPEEWIRQIRIM